MDNQQLRDLAQQLLTNLQVVVPDAGQRTAVSKEIRAALEQADIDALRVALDRNPAVRAWMQKHNTSPDRFTLLAGNATSPQDVMYRCSEDQFEETFGISLLDDPPCPLCGKPMPRVEG